MCELQGYVYDAWLRMAEIFDALGKSSRATALRIKAADLFKRFNEAFWDEESGFYALTLDGNKRKVLTVASNQGHCLWSGIVPPARAGKVMKRLMAPDMWSGWGIRTLSALHPAFNPYNYQTGSVWPHDNAIIALGFKRYGFGVEAARIAGDISDAGSHFLHSQLPELYTTIQRDEASFPVQYLGANIPQAWAAGSVFALMQAMLGCVPDAPRGKLLVDPWLPARPKPEDCARLEEVLSLAAGVCREWRRAAGARLALVFAGPKPRAVDGPPGPGMTENQLVALALEEGGEASDVSSLRELSRSALAAPTLVIHGRLDPRTEPGELDTVRGELPNSQMQILDDGAHSPHSESVTAELANETMNTFVRRLSS